MEVLSMAVTAAARHSTVQSRLGGYITVCGAGWLGRAGLLRKCLIKAGRAAAGLQIDHTRRSRTARVISDQCRERGVTTDCLSVGGPYHAYSDQIEIDI